MDKEVNTFSLSTPLPSPPPLPPPMQNLVLTQPTVKQKKRSDVHRQFEDYVEKIYFQRTNTIHSAILQEGPTFEDQKRKNYEHKKFASGQVFSGHLYYFFSLQGCFRCTNTVHSSLLQNGRTCGLVALSMALATSTEPGPEISQLLNVATELNYSKQGEMFSAKWMADLAQRFGAKVSLIEGGLDNHFQCISDCLLSGGLVLVPYDSDFNFRPCCKSGHKAHWALIFGLYVCSFTCPPTNVPPMFLRPCDCSSSPPSEIQQSVSPILGNESEFGVCFTKDSVQVRPLTKIPTPAMTIFVSAVEGKSIGTMTWPFADLVASNNNLTKLCPKRDAHVHVLPSGGVSAGLKGQAVLLHLNRSVSSDS